MTGEPPLPPPPRQTDQPLQPPAPEQSPLLPAPAPPAPHSQSPLSSQPPQPPPGQPPHPPAPAPEQSPLLSQPTQPPPEFLPPPATAPEQDPFWGYSDLLLFAGLALPCMLLGMVLVKAVTTALHLHAALKVAELLPAQFLGYLLLFGSLGLMFHIQYNRPFWQSLGWTPMRLPPLAVVASGLGAAFAVVFTGVLIHVPNTSNPMTELLQDRLSIILVAVFGVTLGPLCEELAFRGFLQPLLVRSLGALPGILLAALAFGLLHYPEYGNSWRHAVLISLAGAAFGVMRHVTGSTKSATLMHASYNALFFLALFSQGKGLPHQ